MKRHLNEKKKGDRHDRREGRRRRLEMRYRRSGRMQKKKKTHLLTTFAFPFLHSRNSKNFSV